MRGVAEAGNVEIITTFTTFSSSNTINLKAVAPETMTRLPLIAAFLLYRHQTVYVIITEIISTYSLNPKILV